jgi:hypothetical protein
MHSIRNVSRSQLDCHNLAKGYLTIEDLESAIRRTCKAIPNFVLEQIFTEFAESENHITYGIFFKIMDYDRTAELLFSPVQD